MGPIRPPSEAGSILLRLTRNCPWNKCAFCHSYRGQKFSFRTVDEIKADIDNISRITEGIRNTGGGGDAPHEYAAQVAFWMRFGMRSIFLQDADSMSMKTADLVEVLDYAREKFPSVKRITTYSRAKSVSRKSPEELAEIRAAGLDRIHIGMESGSDRVLELINKGATKKDMIDAGRKAIAAGFELSEYFMPGIGGAGLSDENARESAAVLNEVDPTFIRIRSAVPLPDTPLFELMTAGKWTPLSEEGKVSELRLFIASLEGIGSTVASDHIMNLLEEVGGKLPGDREKMIGVIDRFLGMETDDRESFIVGRRLGRYGGLSDLDGSADIEEVKIRLKRAYGSLDEGIMQLLRNYI